MLLTGMNRRNGFLVLVLSAVLGCAFSGCSESRILHEENVVLVEQEIYQYLRSRSKMNPGLCDVKSSINTGFFENVDSVMKSVGYDIFDQLIKKANTAGNSANDSSGLNCVAPFFRFSKIVFDSTNQYAMLSYKLYVNPLFSEEVCAIFKVIHTKRGSVDGVNLVWAQRISVS